MISARIRLLCPLAMVLAGACGPCFLSEDQVVGDDGKLVFSISDCLKCNPVALRAGSRDNYLSVRRVEGAFADPDDPDPFGDLEFLRGSFEISSDDEAVLTARVDSGDDPPTFWLDSHAAGEARVTIKEQGGVAIDSTTIRVLVPTELILFTATDTRAPIDSLRVAVGAEVIPFVAVRCADGDLVSAFGWTFAVDDLAVASLWDPAAALVSPNAQVARVEDTGSFIYVKGEAPGTTALHVSGSQIERTIPVTVE
jgi:hypothetical protein